MDEGAASSCLSGVILKCGNDESAPAWRAYPLAVSVPWAGHGFFAAVALQVGKPMEMLSGAVRRYETMQAIVENLRERVVALEDRGCLEAAEHVSKLLAVYEDTLEICRQALLFERFKSAKLRPASPDASSLVAL